MHAVSRRNFLSLDFGTHGRSEAGDHWIRVHRTAMACRFEVLLQDPEFIGAAREALDEADRIERLLTVFRDDSEVARLNRGGSGGPVRCDPELVDIIQRCRELHAATSGAFDVTSTPLSRCWGFLRREGRVPSASELEQALAACGMRHVRLDDGTVAFDRPGLELNFGAFGKGYALDRMSAVLAGAGVRRALLSAGHSSVVAVGDRGDGDGWLVDLRPTLARQRVGRVWMANAALGMSGAGEQYFEVDGVRYGHVIDPRNGRPAAGIAGAAAFTQSGAAADALSTAFLIGGSALAEAYCDAHPGTQAIVVPDDPGARPQVFGHCPGIRLE